MKFKKTSLTFSHDFFGLTARLFRREPKLNQHGRIYILPTSVGWVFLVFVVVIILSSAIFDNKGQQFLGFFLMGIFALTLTLAHFNLAGFLIDSLSIADDNRGVFEGDGQVRVKMGIKQSLSSRWRVIGTGKESRKAVRLEQIKIKIFAEGGFHFELRVPDLDLHTEKKVEIWADHSLKRGFYEICRVEISTAFPFGLFQAWRKVKTRHKLWVFAKPHAVVLESEESWGEQEERQAKARLSLGGIVFQGIQEVTSLDSPRRLIPQQDPLRGTWLIKKFAEEEDAIPYVKWDHQPGNKEEKLGAISTMAMQSDRFLLESPFFSGMVNGPAEKQRLLRQLAEVRV